MKRPWLLPFTPLYAAGLALRNYRIDRSSERVQRLRWPVVSVGNLSTGGAGKTPLTIALARALAARGLHVDVLSRGYGRRDSRPARVRVDGTADEFGDEPLLIAREAGVPVYVARRRYEAGLLAQADWAAEHDGRAGVHLLDDGFQHRRLARDVDILMINREDWHGSLLPAGNLREPRSAARRATVIAIPADEPELEADLRAWGWTGPIWRLRRTMAVPEAAVPVAAFCGIARPEQFFRGLEAAGLRLASRVVFRDHHRYNAGDSERLIAGARAARAAALITTEKDLVRMGSLTLAFPEDMPVKAAGLRVEIENEVAAVDWILSRVGAGV